MGRSDLHLTVPLDQRPQISEFIAASNVSPLIG